MTRAFGLLSRMAALSVVAVAGGFAAAVVDDDTDLAAPPVRPTTAGTTSARTTAAPAPSVTTTPRPRPPGATPRPATHVTTLRSRSVPGRAATVTGARATTVSPTVTFAPARPAPPSSRRGPVVPNVVGQTYPRARDILLRAGFDVATNVVPTQDERRDLRVRTQSPPPGTSSPPGTRVLLVVERYAPSGTTTQ